MLCTVPYDRTVASLELAQIQAETKAAVLYGGDLVEGRLASSLIVGVNSMPDLLGNWKDVHAPLVMLYASQGEVLLSTLLAAISPGLPPLGGILILGEGELGEEVKRVVDNIEVPVPVLRSKHRIHDMIRNKGAIIDKVREACAAAREMDQTGAPYEGPIQFDAAVDPEVAKVKFKGKENAVAGKATVCVFPDLNAGNNAYKAVQQASGCIAMGPIMQGMKKPVNDLSRGCTVDDIVNTVVITCIQAQAVVGQAP